MKERRTFPRFDEPVLVAYRVLGRPALETKSVSDDISEGGVRFPIDERLRVGSLLRLEIRVPFISLSLVGQGIIVWQKRLDKDIGKWRYVIGIKFTKMALLDKRRLQGFLKNRLPPIGY